METATLRSGSSGSWSPRGDRDARLRNADRHDQIQEIAVFLRLEGGGLQCIDGLDQHIPARNSLKAIDQVSRIEGNGDCLAFIFRFHLLSRLSNLLTDDGKLHCIWTQCHANRGSCISDE